MPVPNPRILVTGAFGQIGSELTVALRQAYGEEQVVATDIALPQKKEARPDGAGPFATLDVTEPEAVLRLIKKHNIDTVVHLAALLSATGERKPERAWQVNVAGTLNILNAAREQHLSQVIIPSSIAVFGPETPRKGAPNDTILRPTTMYGITKVTCELLGNYYGNRYGLDVRGLRFPGIISAVTPPSGGTTDYAVEMFYAAVANQPYTCFVQENTRLPMMYMPDCIAATLDLMRAPRERLRHHTDFNVGALDFTAGELAEEIRKHIPGLRCTYLPDFRQEIADSWPDSLDDSVARDEWGWRPRFDLESMTRDMIHQLRRRQAAGTLLTLQEAV